MILGIFLFLVNLFFWRGLLAGKLAIPLDAMVGVYHPWADHFWGFVAGVPYRNIALTDVFSQLYPWRTLAMDIVRQGHWPLWNPYSFAGYPLAANWQSAPFFPLNLLMLWLGNSQGYSLMVAAQPLMAAMFMILFLRQIGLSKPASYLGAISFAFGGFMMTYLEYSTTGQILAMIPLALYLVEKYYQDRKFRYLVGLAVVVFLVLTGGFFQPAFFALLIIGAYVLVSGVVRTKKIISVESVTLAASLVLGIGLAGIQLGPTVELLRYSIRNLDHNIAEYHYGLLPIKHLITLLAPDFFGNPVTGNYFGFMQYQETSGYFGVIGLGLAVAGLLAMRKNWRQMFFGSFFVLALGLCFDNPISRLVFTLKLPFLSTGYASRWLMVLSFSGAALAAYGVDLARKRKRLMIGLLVLVILLVIYPGSGPISQRNLLLPLGLTVAGLVISVLPKKVNLLLLCLLVTFDLLRYADKFTPVVRSDYATTKIDFLTNLHERAGINRVAIDQGPLMSANTWIYPKLYSVTGYDPLLFKDYEVWFRALNVGFNPKQKIDGSLGEGAMTRYLNLDNPFSPLLDLAGVKYFLTLKKDPLGRFKSEGSINGEYLKKYKVIDAYGATVLLENTTPMERFGLYYTAETEMDDTKAAERLVAGFDFRTKILLKEDSPEQFVADKLDAVSLVSYGENEVKINATTKNGAYLLLTDTDYPGWQAEVNDRVTRIIRADGIFRAVRLPPGEVLVRFFYFPKSFMYGLLISGLSAGILLGVALIAFLKKKL